jgi:hypothetical protein
MDDWRRAAGGMDETLADDRGLIVVTESERTPFLNLVVARFGQGFRISGSGGWRAEHVQGTTRVLE